MVTMLNEVQNAGMLIDWFKRNGIELDCSKLYNAQGGLTAEVQSQISLILLSSNIEKIKFLFGSGYNFNNKTSDGSNGFIDFISYCYRDLEGPELAIFAEMINSERINLNHQDNFGNAALHCAINSKRSEMAKVLINGGCDLSLKAEGDTVLDLAQGRNLEDVVNVIKAKLHADRMKTVSEPDTYKPGAADILALDDVSSTEHVELSGNTDYSDSHID